ncbi:MAG TPA: hypothetical protein VL442_09390 [Mucilaginibacter sp.]|jgi:hypothetical protein|nr:hypothetical protein [Mucilaginibacter sp.]
MNKLAFALIALFLTLQKTNKPKTVVLLNDHLEILNGSVKQIIATGKDLRGTPFLQRYIDTLNFDKLGNEIGSCSDWTDGLHFKSTVIMNRPNNERQLEVLTPLNNSKIIYMYKGSQIKKAYCYNKNGIYQEVRYSYDANDKVIEEKVYNNSNVLHNKITYKYDENGFLSEEYYFPLNAKQYGSKTHYEYQSIDKIGNWTKMVRNMKGLNDSILFFTDTITRKITYY